VVDLPALMRRRDEGKQLHRAVVTAAIEPKPPNGVVDQMVPGRSVMLVDCIMRS